MIINTEVLDYSHFYRILNISRDENFILVNSFLSRFYELYDNFKSAVLDNAHKSHQVSIITHETAKLKEFISKAGGIRAAKILAEYEKCASIADFACCSRIEKNLFEELEAFREVVVSMFS